MIREAWRYGIHEFVKDVNDNYIKADEGENNFGYDYQNPSVQEILDGNYEINR